MFHFHKWSLLAPLSDGTDRWFKLCLKCGDVKIVNER